MLRQLVPKQQGVVYMKRQLKAIGIKQNGMLPIDVVSTVDLISVY